MWIDLKKKRPPIGVSVLVFNNMLGIQMSFCDGDGKLTHSELGHFEYGSTHWMPEPLPPDDATEDGLIFICPKCKGQELEEITDGLTSTLIQLDKHGDYVSTGEVNLYGDIERFQCNQCGFVLAGITNSEDAANWIIENCKEEVDVD